MIGFNSIALFHQSEPGPMVFDAATAGKKAPTKRLAAKEPTPGKKVVAKRISSTTRNSKPG
jgi:hypothetical protein